MYYSCTGNPIVLRASPNDLLMPTRFFFQTLFTRYTLLYKKKTYRFSLRYYVYTARRRGVSIVLNLNSKTSKAGKNIQINRD